MNELQEMIEEIQEGFTEAQQVHYLSCILANKSFRSLPKFIAKPFKEAAMKVDAESRVKTIAENWNKFS